MDVSTIFSDYPDLITLIRSIDRYEWLFRSCTSPEAYAKYDMQLKALYERLQAYYDTPQGFLAVDIASKIVQSYRSRLKRVRRRISYYLSLGPCLFVTLTFTDDVLDSTSFDSRKAYVRRWCKSAGSCYVANVDYGAKNEREHYHCVLLADSVDHSSWPYGMINFQRIRGSSFKDWKTSSGKLSRYTAKLAMHALKDTTNQASVIYSRGKIPEEIFKSLDSDEILQIFS